MHRRWVRAPVAYISQSATYRNLRSLDRPLHLPPSPLQTGLNSAGTWHPRTLYRSIYEQLHTRYCMAICRPSMKHRSSSVYEKRRTASTVVAPRRRASFHVNTSSQSSAADV